MADLEKVSNKNLEDTQMVEEAVMTQIQVKRKLELDGIPIIKNIKKEDCEISKEVEDVNKNCTEVQTSPYQSYPLDYLPDLVLEKILGFLSFHEITKARMVCLRFNDICKRQLNRGFRSIQNFHKKCLEETLQDYHRKHEKYSVGIQDAFLRRNLINIDVLLLFLNLTFLKYIEANQFCFIPGKIIDDISRYLWRMKKVQQTSKGTTLNVILFSELKEEREKIINSSNMAMKHFLSEILSMSKITITPPRIFSSNTSFELLILRSFIGSLTFDDITQCQFIYEYALEIQIENYLKYLKEEFEAACFKEHDRLQLLKRDIEADKILGQVSLNNQSFYLVKWKGINEADFFTYEECTSKFQRIWERYDKEIPNMPLLKNKFVPIKHLRYVQLYE